jgi:predicted enzyme related to lactoylglutathione lyase
MARFFFILYVADQNRSRNFYEQVLQKKPALDVPGMTEFLLGEDCSLGLMPEAGIRSLLGPALPDPEKGRGIPRAELYMTVPHPAEYHNRVLTSGGKEVSNLTSRPWGDTVAYSLDPDGHVLAFAEKTMG